MPPERNAPCPCGSGKKYKKCCIDKSFSSAPVTSPQKQQTPFLHQHNSVELFKSIAALSIQPENHGKGVRMELLMADILAGLNMTAGPIATPALKKFLDTDYSSHHMEDSTVNQFTDLVSFYGGDYLIFPGVIEGGSFVLTNLVTAIFHWPDTDFDSSFKTNCFMATKFILTLSNLVAERLGYVRYQPGAATEEEIFVPDEARFATAKASVVLTREEMQALLSSSGIAAQVVEQFTFTTAEFNANNTPEPGPGGYLWRKPIVSIGDEYIIVSPLTMPFALAEFIWRQSAQWHCAQELDQAYQDVLWNTLQLQLKHMGFIHEDIPEHQLPSSQTSHYGTYRFDEDKIALVELAHTPRPTSGRGAEIGFRAFNVDGALLKSIMALPQYAGHQFMHLVIASFDGSDVMLSFPKQTVAHTLVIPVQEFEVLSILRDNDAIDLWKFIIAKNQFLAKSFGPLLQFSFLDLFKLYRKHQDSFYFSDESEVNIIHVMPGYAAEMVAEAKLKTDSHSALLKAPRGLGRIPLTRKDEYGPVYYNINDVLSSELRFLVGGFPQPVWVTPSDMSPDVSDELRSWFFQATDAIAYWLWQLQESLRPFLDHPQLELIHVSYDCRPLESFEDVAHDFARVPDLASYFATRATADTAHITIPSELLPFLYGPDNEGERVLVRQLLIAVNAMLAVNSLPLIPDEALNVMIEAHVPLGVKKKVYLLHSADNLLIDPRYLVPKRTLQEYDTSVVLDSLVPELGTNCPAVGELATTVEKQNLTWAIVMGVLLPKLKRTIGRYNQQDLLVKLLALNETLIYQREMLRINTPSRIACFVSVEQQIADVKENLGDANRTSIAVRCLIEHISAEQTRQGALASTTDMDELVAIMDQIIAWGSMGDQLTHELFDIKIGVLPTRRIGTQKTLLRDILDPYYTSKTQEDVADAIKYYDQVFPQLTEHAGGEVPASVDKAFTADYGISFSRLCEFVEALVEIAFQREESIVSMPKNQLQQEVNRLGHSFDQAEFEAAINYWSLTKRANVETPPPGYDNFDISPWRFNRQLSLLRKPIVAFDNPEEADNPVMYWGFRQALVSRRYLGSQLFDNRLRVPQKGQILKVLGDIATKQGEPLVRKIAARLSGPGLIVDTEVYINPRSQLKHDKDIGDVDVLVIDVAGKRIFSLECKNFSPSRNIREMVEELGKILGKGSDKGLMHKHVVRHQWLEQHLDELGKKYDLDLTGFTVLSFMVTAEEMITPNLAKQGLALPFVTSYAIEERGIDALTASIGVTSL